MQLQSAPDIRRMGKAVLSTGIFPYIKAARIFYMRSTGATSRARARIWSFPKIFQMALSEHPCYVIEVLSHHFDHLSDEDKFRVIIHELMHIPKNFSGALVPHRGRHKRIDSRTVEAMYKIYRNLLEK